MAVAIIGGLVTSTVLTLGIVPVVYSLIDGIRTRVWKTAAKPGALHAAPAEPAEDARAAGK
jgi:HAE1 family hydrophobic/amphiphilic exporter-1